MSPLAKSSKDPQSPFLDISSFSVEESEVVDEQEVSSARYEIESPFQSIYELEEQVGTVDPDLD
jgi:hypothetical protein